MCKWREEKEHLAEQAAEMEAVLMEEAEKERAKQEKKRQREMSRKRLRVQLYHEEREEEKEREEAWLGQLREEAEELKREARRRGHDRVVFRQDQLAEKTKQQRLVMEERLECAREKEKRLEALRQQVTKTRL